MNAVEKPKAILILQLSAICIAAFQQVSAAQDCSYAVWAKSKAPSRTLHGDRLDGT